MEQMMKGRILALVLILSLFISGSAFANTYSFVLVDDSDVIHIYDMDGGVQKAMIDLSNDPQAVLDEADFSANGDDILNLVGEKITAMLVNDAGSFLYFVTEAADNSGQLYRLNIGLYLDDEAGSTQPFSTVTPLTSVGNSPRDLVEGNSGYEIYVANYGSDSITIFDMNPLYETPVATTIEGFYAPVAIDVTIGDDVFVANSATNGDGKYVVSVYNSYETIEIEVPNSPTDVLVTPDYEYVYVCNSPAASGLVSVIKPVDYNDVEDDGDDIVDEGENTIISSVTVADAVPSKLTFIKGGNMILAVDPASRVLSEIDSSGRMNHINTLSQNHSNFSAHTGFANMFGAQDGSIVYSVTGADEKIYLTDMDTGLTSEPSVFSGVTDVIKDIVLRSARPLPIDDLETDEEVGETTLEWKDESDNETGFLIYRFDHNDDDKEYKYYLLDTIEQANVQIYVDNTVTKGDRYSYRIIPFNDFSRGLSTEDVSSKAKDESDTKICFISNTAGCTNNIAAILLTVGFTFLALAGLIKRKI